MLMCSGGVTQSYQVLKMVFGFASVVDGCGGTLNTQGAYHAALQRLEESATAIGAHGVLFIGFQNRVASAQGCTGPKQAFEVFAWGTAVTF
ncbi:MULTISPECIES: heavy metal-binding domain-containing protein [Sorangium]|jgi:uncharacterized protein YbjQ (UPF0145 family)|uniref:Uncharacterized protein n=1 Tax=Sorangium cellulosum TaxID=56 RepID=A0A4V0NF31_SORCE|nr:MULTISPECIES: heavy metal-binding domain-containing protein [Sorangium]AUX28252.1 uncharacterized protein SOCE836_003200 [Sorangium cellulosum]WCQ87644.1 hypothetical protein NQZ70_00307 [Sorangium sp. Soce836]